eukprot:TRINITY_DN2445_c1_g2_i1.p1 TRINITY_DN2445_c1_g2~~TRINITY_DN2445_c1_g2_i1.p1  ORF type:complete len:325 (+),score=129.00 TRINITY_DN2445_c1_g2_i1:389-1363(+)
MSKSNAPSITLNPTGQKMPQVGFGLWKVDNATCADTVYNAVKSGYRLFDGACDYGNEKEAGQGLKRAFTEGLVKREEIFLTSKLWNTFHKREHVKQLCKKQLEDYGVEYFDLFLIHFPISLAYVDPKERYPPGWAVDGKDKQELQDTPIRETWEAMEQLVDEGLVKNIGISNFQGVLILDLLRYARIRPAVLQVELHPYLQQNALINLCKQQGIAVTAYSSFGPQSFVELKMDKGTPTLFEHETVTSIAKKHKKEPAQVLLRWATQQGLAVIPKSNNQNRLEQNLHCCDFDLSEDDVKALAKLNQNIRFNDPGHYLNPPVYIFA